MVQKKRNNFKFFKIICFIIIYIFYGCKDIKRDIEGLWVIEAAKLDSKNALDHFQIEVNIMQFSYNGDCLVPGSYWVESRNSKWKVEQKNEKNYLIFFTKSPYFNDTFQLDTISLKKIVFSNKHKYVRLDRTL